MPVEAEQYMKNLLDCEKMSVALQHKGANNKQYRRREEKKSMQNYEAIDLHFHASYMKYF